MGKTSRKEEQLTEWIQQPNFAAKYTRTVETVNDQGETVQVQSEEFGQMQWAYRRSGDHVIVFSGVAADQPQPDYDPADDREGEQQAEASEAQPQPNPGAPAA